jgi:hypothetical protein
MAMTGFIAIGFGLKFETGLTGVTFVLAGDMILRGVSCVSWW